MCVSLCVHVCVFPNSFCLQELRKLSRASLLVRNCSFKRYRFKLHGYNSDCPLALSSKKRVKISFSWYSLSSNFFDFRNLS